jgi:hypothetical protein
MVRKFLKSGVLAVALSVALGGCAEVAASGPVTKTHCGKVYHDEGFPSDPNPKHAYRCKSDANGFIRRDHIDPLTPDWSPRI